jgi:hypothetical protein
MGSYYWQKATKQLKLTNALCPRALATATLENLQVVGGSPKVISGQRAGLSKSAMTML